MPDTGYPSGVSVVYDSSNAVYTVATPYHSKVVDWARCQPFHFWDKTARVWQIKPTAVGLAEFHKLCWELWPSGQAQAERTPGFARRPYRKQTTAAGTLLTGRCAIQGCGNGAMHHYGGRIGMLCSPCHAAVQAGPQPVAYVAAVAAVAAEPVAAPVQPIEQSPTISMPSDSSDEELARLFG